MTEPTDMGRHNPDHKRPSIGTYSGVEFFPLSPHVEDVRLEDIASGLSKKCRYTGQCGPFYCPTPDQRVLTAGLEWVPAGDLKTGDELVGFDEDSPPGRYGRRRWPIGTPCPLRLPPPSRREHGAQRRTH